MRNMAGALLLTAQLTANLSLVCDRCMKPFDRVKTVEFETLLASELENGENDEIVLLDKDEQLDLDELMGDGVYPQFGHKESLFRGLQGHLSRLRRGSQQGSVPL